LPWPSTRRTPAVLTHHGNWMQTNDATTIATRDLMAPEHDRQRTLATDDHAMTIEIAKHLTAHAAKASQTDVHRATQEVAEMILAVLNSTTVEIELKLLSVNNPVDIAMMVIVREIKIVMTDAVSSMDRAVDVISQNETNEIAATIARTSLGEVDEKAGSQIEAKLDVTHQRGIVR
jgi:hypothetical protein